MLLHFLRHETCLRPWVTTCAGTFLSNRLVFLSLLWHSSLFYNTNMAVSPHEEKMIGIQRQLRQNQQDLQDFLFDLGSWEDEMKRKEQELRKEKSDEPQVWHLKCIVFSNHYYRTLPNFLDNSFAYISENSYWMIDCVTTSRHKMCWLEVPTISTNSLRLRRGVGFSFGVTTFIIRIILLLFCTWVCFHATSFAFSWWKLDIVGFSICVILILDLERIRCRNHPSLKASADEALSVSSLSWFQSYSLYCLEKKKKKKKKKKKTF